MNIAYKISEVSNIVYITIGAAIGVTATIGLPMVNVNNIPVTTSVYYNESGNENNRPTDPPIGFRFFDTSLGTNGTPIFYAGSGVWVYADGTVVS